MADKSQDSKARFAAAAERNRAKVERLIRGTMRAGATNVSELDARAMLERVRSMDKTIPSDPAHVALVDSIVRGNGWQYRPRPSG